MNKTFGLFLGFAFFPFHPSSFMPLANDSGLARSGRAYQHARQNQRNRKTSMGSPMSTRTENGRPRGLCHVRHAI